MSIEDLIKNLNIRSNFKSLKDLLDSWEDVVIECQNEYNQNTFELDYDLIVRGEIQLLLNNEFFISQDTYQPFYSKVCELDNSFLKLIIFLDEDNEKPFWERKFILKNAGENYKCSISNIK